MKPKLCLLARILIHLAHIGSLVIFFADPAGADLSQANEILADYSGYYGTNYICEIRTLTNSDPAQVKMGSRGLLECLKNVVSKKLVSDLEERWRDAEWLSPSEIESNGLRIKVDHSEFKILFFPSREDVLPKVSSLERQSQIDLRPSPAINPAISGYLNYSVTGALTHTEQNSNLDHSEIYALNPSVSAGGVVLESYHRTDSGNSQLRRIETFATKDFENSFMRLRAGDNYSPTSSLIDQFRFLGVSVNRNYLFSENFINRPLGEREIFLERPAKVDIFVNYVLISTLSLQEGRHLLKEIPTNQGINSVLIRITEIGGATRTVVFQTAVEENLFRAGYSDYSFNIGQINQSTTEDPVYATDAAGSAFYRYGLTNQLTLGSSIAGRSNLGIGSLDATLGTNRGIFKLELGASDQVGTLGYGARFSYSWICACSIIGRDRRFNLGVESYSDNFVRQISEQLSNSSPNLFGVFSSYSQSLDRASSIRLSTNLNRLRASPDLSYALGIEYNRNLSNRVLIGTRYSGLSNGGSSSIINEFGLQMIYHFDGGLTTAVADHVVTSGQSSRSRAGVNYSNPLAYETALGEVSKNGDGYQADLQASKGFEHIDLRGQLLTSNYEGQLQERLSLNPAGSIVFGGGHFGLGRYIRDSYILFSNQTKRAVYLNGDEDVNEATIKPGSISIITNTQAYRTKVISVASTSDNFYDSAQTLVRLRPRYKSLLVYDHRKIEEVWISGRLTDKAGKPVGMTAGSLVCESQDPVSFFTDYDGKFLVQSAGKPCKMTVDSHPFETAYLNPATIDSGVQNVGQVILTSLTDEPKSRDSH